MARGAASPVRRTQAERAEASERALVDAAVRLIAERGYERTTLAAVGDAAGYSRGLVTQRFGSKEGLLWAVVGRMVTVWGAQSLAPRIGERVGVDALRTTLEVYLESLAERPDAIRAYYALLREADGPLTDLREQVAQLQADERDAIAGWIAAGQAAGAVRSDIDPRAEATAFLGVIRGVTLQWTLDPASVDVVGALTQYGAHLARSLGVAA